MKNDVALFTVFYPGIELYMDDFMSSVRSQTFTRFDLVIINDRYKYQNLKNLYNDVSLVEIQFSSTFSKNREHGINYIKEKGYKYIVLADADDFFSSERIEKSVNVLTEYDIVVNDLNIVSSSGGILAKSYFSHAIKSSGTIGLDFIKDKNIFGFSNTAIRLDALPRINFPAENKIVDWYLFTELLQKRLSAYYLSESLTSYRQHADNLIGIDNFSLELFKKLVDLKIAHYSYFREEKDYNVMYEKMRILKSMTNEEIRDLISRNKKINPFPLWWENITI